VRAEEEKTMTKLAIVISGTLFSGLVALSAQAADKAPAAGAAPAPAGAAAKEGTAAKAPVAAKEEPAAKAGAPAAGAPAAAPAGPPAPPPEVDQLYKGLEGSWKCETTFNAGAFGPGSPEMKAKSEVKVKKEPGGFWYKGEYKVKKTKTNPEVGATFLLGYDAAGKSATNVTYDNMGGYSVEHAPGATADKVAFAGDGSMMGSKVKVRETMTHKDPKTVEHTYEVDMGKGFQLIGTDVCKK
jgi:hypothetical protein